MDLTIYLSIARRWAWLLITGLVLGLVLGFVVAKLQTPIFQAGTRVIVSRASMQAASGGSLTSGAEIYYVNEQVLMQTFIELLKSSSIFEKASQALGYKVSSGQVEAAQVGETRILGITVEDPDPQHAADIANAVVAALNQSIVRCRPTRKGVSEVNPNSCLARSTFSFRRGCPSGFEESKASSPLKPVSSATSVVRSRIEISSELPRLTGAGLS